MTVAAIPVDKKHAAEFGVIEVAPDGRIIAFHEKRADAPTIPGDPDRVYASMGNYIFSTRTLLRELYEDAANEGSSHDFGHNILPKLAGNAEMYAYDFQTNRYPRRSIRFVRLLARRRHHRCLLRRQYGPALREARAQSL